MACMHSLAEMHEGNDGRVPVSPLETEGQSILECFRHASLPCEDLRIGVASCLGFGWPFVLCSRREQLRL